MFQKIKSYLSSYLLYFNDIWLINLKILVAKNPESISDLHRKWKEKNVEKEKKSGCGCKVERFKSLERLKRRYLCDQEACDAFREPPLLTGQNHLQHVSVKLLHDHEDVLRRLKHALQQHHAQVRQVLQKHREI